MTTQELKSYINRVLGSGIRCLLPSYWWKRLFGLVVDKVDEDKEELNSRIEEVSTFVQKNTVYIPIEGGVLSDEMLKQNALAVNATKRIDDIVFVFDGEKQKRGANLIFSNGSRLRYIDGLLIKESVVYTNGEVTTTVIESIEGESYDDTEIRNELNLVSERIDDLNSEKQDTLVSGGNIKTINGQDVLGSGNLEVGSVAGVDVGEEVDDVETHYATEEYVDSAVEGKQDTLISGENIKTINGESVLGSGNITIQGGGSSYDDTELRNSLNAVTERVDDLSSEIEDKVNETSIATINGQNLVNGGNVVVGDVASVATGDVVDDVEMEYATKIYVDNAIAQAIISTINANY